MSVTGAPSDTCPTEGSYVVRSGSVELVGLADVESDEREEVLR